MSYHLEDRLLESCNCNVLCPCWIGENPDNNACYTTIAWRIAKGTVDDTDVAASTIAAVALVPGNILDGNWTAAIYLDDHASQEQEEALLKVYTGKAGKPVVELAKLIGEVVSVERAPVKFTVGESKGDLEIGEKCYAELEPYRGATDGQTTFSGTVFSTVPGAPVFGAKAPSYRSKKAVLGIDLDIKDHNALQSTFVFDA